MKKSTRITVAGIAALILMTMVAYGCGGGGGGYGGGGYGSTPSQPMSSSNFPIVDCATAANITNVTVADYSFTPSSVPINANGVVKWTNNGAMTHSVTSGTVSGSTPNPDGNFDATLSPGATVCIQFLKTGTYPYYCKFHPTLMQATVTVQ